MNAAKGFMTKLPSNRTWLRKKPSHCSVKDNTVWRTFNSKVRKRFELLPAAGCGLTLILSEANRVDKQKYKHMTHNPCYFHFKWNISTPPGEDCFNSAGMFCWLCSEGEYSPRIRPGVYKGDGADIINILELFLRQVISPSAVLIIRLFQERELHVSITCLFFHLGTDKKTSHTISEPTHTEYKNMNLHSPSSR